MVVTTGKKVSDEDLIEKILETIKNQPSTFSEITEKLEIENLALAEVLKHLVEEGIVEKMTEEHRIIFHVNQNNA